MDSNFTRAPGDSGSPTATDSELADGFDYDVGLLRLTTAGSVDDGKSTLIGRLLYDTKSIFEDQLEAVERASLQRGEGYVNLALLTDGLRAEREQNITIDVAYRYFATPRRKFIIADTPGHVQYTRNMVTGASLADLAVVLVDARKGVQTQSKRHGFIASLLGIPNLVVAVNKMDLVDYDETVYEGIATEYRNFVRELRVTEPTFIPMSALRGENVVERGETMPWYEGPTLLEHLETVEVTEGPGAAGFRFPVQYVIRPHQDFRGFAGRVASGSLRPGDEVVVLPGGRSSRIASVATAEGDLDAAGAGQSVVVTLRDELDVSRGDVLVPPSAPPVASDNLEAILCWMSDEPLDPDAVYLLMHTTRQIPARVSAVAHRVDVDTLASHPAETLQLNDIARVRIATAEPIFFDPYEVNHETGSFILIHPHTHGTLAAGMIQGVAEGKTTAVSPDVVWEEWNIPREERELRNGHGAAVLWFTGLSGAGKTTIARELERTLFAAGIHSVLLDGDQLRHGLCGDLGFRPADRRENLRRAGEVAKLFFETGAVVLAAFVSPYRNDRERVRALIPEGRFFEVHVDADLDTCRARDPKGLYARADAGEIPEFTGVSAPYEAPERPELALDTTRLSADDAVERILLTLQEVGVIPANLGRTEKDHGL
jgi:bifunctional enzyme CysN/CysC